MSDDEVMTRLKKMGTAPDEDDYPMPRLYYDLARDWYQLLTPVEDYEEAAELYHQILSDTGVPIRTMLELGSGAGHNAYFLKQWYHITLSDLSDQMLALSSKLNPDCEHLQGDMRTLRLDRVFDSAFIHDAIIHMASEADLKRALKTAFVHIKAGGVALITPDFVRETYKNSTDHGGVDGEHRSLRYLEWTTDPNPSDTEVTLDLVYALKNADGRITTAHDQFIVGLFSRNQWLDIMKAVGFEPKALEDTKFGRVNFLGTKPG